MPLEAGIDVYVSVNVFGIIRIRADWFVANNEILKARTALEIMAVEHKSGRLIMPPQDVGAESEYNEQYVLWAGPLTVRKIMRKLETPLCDFSDLATAKIPPKISTEEGVTIDFPFRYSVEKGLHENKKRWTAVSPNTALQH